MQERKQHTGSGNDQKTGCGQIIVLYGIDASGKSTHTTLLAEYLRKKHRVYVTSISIRHLIMFLVYKFLDRYGRKVQAIPYRLLPVLPKDRVRLWLEFISIVLLVLKVKLLRAMGYVVIIEKYIPFTIASLAYIYGSSFLQSKTANILSRFMNGVCQIRLDIDYATHLSRRGMNSESVKWILCQRQVYEHFAQAKSCTTIDTDRLNLEETHCLVRQIVDSMMNTEP